jgi:hypothetical protein
VRKLEGDFGFVSLAVVAGSIQDAREYVRRLIGTTLLPVTKGSCDRRLHGPRPSLFLFFMNTNEGNGLYQSDS